MIKRTTTMTNFDQDAIMADMYCAQIQTGVNMGDSTFNVDIHEDLEGDDYADAMMMDLLENIQY